MAQKLLLGFLSSGAVVIFHTAVLSNIQNLCFVLTERESDCVCVYPVIITINSDVLFFIMGTECVLCEQQLNNIHICASYFEDLHTSDLNIR
jgi:hypothetical protein